MRRITLSIAVVLLASGMAGCMTVNGGKLLHHWRWGKPAQPSDEARAYAHYLSGVFYERQDQHELAAGEMAAVSDLDPDALTPWLWRIRAHLRNRDFEAALEAAKTAVDLAPDRSNLWVMLGEIHHRLNQYDKATEALKKAIELNPKNPIGYGALGELFENTNDLAAALDVYKQLVELSPKSAGLYYQLGLVYIRMDNQKDARVALTKALALNPRLQRARYLLGVLCFETGQLNEAIAHLSHYLRSRRGDLSALEKLAGALMQTGDPAKAAGIYGSILASGRAQPAHQIQTMYVLLATENPQRAEKVAPPADAPIFSTFFTAIARKMQGLPYKPLVESLDKVEGDLDQECAAYLNDLLYLFGDEIAGAWLLEQAWLLGTEASSRRLDIIRARTLMLLNRYNDAIEVLEPLAEAEDAYPWVYYYLAVSHEELDHFEDTEKYLKAFLEVRPDEPDVLNFLGYLYAEHGVKLDEAEELLEKALELSPDNPYYLDSLGWVYYQRGKADKAVELIQDAIYKMETDDAILRDHLGDAFLLKGDVENAIAEWERAHRLDPELEGVAEKLEKHRGKLEDE